MLSDQRRININKEKNIINKTKGESWLNVVAIRYCTHERKFRWLENFVRRKIYCSRRLLANNAIKILYHICSSIIAVKT